MSEINMDKIVGDKYEDMSIAQMMMVQGSGDIDPRFTTSPACVYFSLASSKQCGEVVSASVSLVSGIVLSIVKC